MEIIDVLGGHAELAEKPVVPEHCHFVAAELHIRFHAIDRVFQRLVESAASVFRRLFIGAAMGEDQGFNHRRYCVLPRFALIDSYRLNFCFRPIAVLRDPRKQTFNVKLTVAEPRFFAERPS